MYASVVTAARQAARYGSATGDNGSGLFTIMIARESARPPEGWLSSNSSRTRISRSTTTTARAGRGSRPAVLSPPRAIRPTGTASESASRLSSRRSFRSSLSGLSKIKSTDNRTLLVAVSIEVTPSGGGFTGGTALALGKSADPITYSTVGQSIAYTYTLQNVGTDPITGPFTITDDKLGSFQCAGAPGTLPGGSAVITCTNHPTYTITAADITAQQVVNHATAVNGDSTVASNQGDVHGHLRCRPSDHAHQSGHCPRHHRSGRAHPVHLHDPE